jgi:endogenous inhibitor of DNA gyrase (YacG/DUF329 family)
MSKELTMRNGEVSGVADGKVACPNCATPRNTDRYRDQWFTHDDGTATCPTCGTEVEDSDA